MPLVVSTQSVTINPVNPNAVLGFAQNSDPTIFIDQLTNGTIVLGHETTFPGQVHGYSTSSEVVFGPVAFGDTYTAFGGTQTEEVEQVSVAALSGGGLIAAWLDSNDTFLSVGLTDDIILQLMNADGTLGASATIEITPGTFDVAPVVATLGDGFALSWINARDQGAFQIYDSSLQALSPVMLYDGDQEPIVVDLGNGTAVVGWEDADGTWFQIVDLSTGEFQGTPTATQDGLVDISANRTGFAILGDGSVEQYDLTGVMHRSIETPRSIDYPAGTIRDENITYLPDGGFIILFTVNDDGETQTFGDADVYALHYGDAEQLLGDGPQRLNVETEGDQGSPVGILLDDGRFAVAWSDSGVDPNREPVVLTLYDVEGSDVNDDVNVVTGTDDGETLSGTVNDDSISAGGGNDLAFAGTGDDTLLGEGGNDTLYGGAGNDVLQGGAGNDLLGGAGGADTMDGGAGNDAIWTAAGNDSAFGGTGDDTLGGAAGDDTLGGGDGEDEIWGADGNDSLSGGADNDTIGGATGNDAVSAGDGADEVWGAAGNDSLLGDGGNDQIGGGLDDDVIDGGAGDDLIFGGLGNDTVDGGAGNDTLYGAAGNDSLSGGAGDDLLFVGPGADVVVFGDGDGADEIQFFSLTEDRIEFDDALWTGTLTATQVVSQFGSVSGSDFVFTFDGGETLTLTDRGTATNLETQIDIV